MLPGVSGLAKSGRRMLVISFAQLSGQPYGSATVILLKYFASQP